MFKFFTGLFYVPKEEKEKEVELIKASFEGHIETVKLLINKGTNINHIDMNVDHIDTYGRTALMMASCKGHIEIVKLLIEAGANLDHKDRDGRTSLMAASYEGCTVTIKLLIKKGANINHKDRDGRTALMWVYKSHKEIVKLLKEKE